MFDMKTPTSTGAIALRIGTHNNKLQKNTYEKKLSNLEIKQCRVPYWECDIIYIRRKIVTSYQQ